jgi:hypothetical protein
MPRMPRHRETAANETELEPIPDRLGSDETSLTN